eukprot:Ihof_evm1s488 gene=Ihof_evmTU1s488
MWAVHSIVTIIAKITWVAIIYQNVRLRLEITDFWQVDLGYQFLVEHISISLRHPKVNISLDLTMTVDGRYCGQIQKYITGTNSTIACEKGGVNGSLVEVKVSPTIPHKFCKCTLNVCGVLASASKIQLLGQFATQSSTYYVGYEADKAIDGISASCAETNDNLEDDPWWEVDMGGPISVYYVTIYHRVSASLYYVNFNVTVDDQLCGVGLNDQYDFLTIMCEKPVTGNILKIQQMRGASRWYTAWFSLCEVEAWGTRVTKQIKGTIMPQVNLFLLWARQSSTWSEDTIASMAIDGNPNTCTQTYDWVDSKPWWTVDMGAIVTVQAFRITNRQSYESRLGNVFVTVDDQACGPIYKNGDSYYLWVTCEKPVTGQLLKIQLLEAPVRGILTLCEVEVWGYFNATRYIVYPVPEVNLIGLPSRQSSTYAISYEASMGNDGNPSTCTWTAPFISNQPWWQVYMGGNVTIHSVK